jgi:hypothetical protein
MAPVISMSLLRCLATLVIVLATGGVHADDDPLPLRIVRRLPSRAARESSGIVQSRKIPDLFWTHNDSGDEPRIYPLRRDGSPWRITGGDDEGVMVDGARHVDWEDITALDDGTLVIADVGNNANRRQDLTLYFVDEPLPTATRSSAARTVHVRYPDQHAFPPPSEERNFDCEAVFAVGSTVHLLTKHRGDSRTKLYRLDHPRAGEVNTLTLVGAYDIAGKVTAADCDRTGRRLLVLTYQAVWLFERPDQDTPFFSGSVRRRRVILPQTEGICFAGDDLALVTDEIADTLLELSLDELRPVVEQKGETKSN